MSRREWRCRNLACPTEHGAVLGRIMDGAGLVLDPGVRRFAVYLDAGRAWVICPSCGKGREFRGRHVTFSVS